MQFDYQEIKKKLGEKGLKGTPQRIAILKALFAMKNHPDTEEIIEFVTYHNPSISQGTIYRTLDLLADHKIISRIQTGSGRMRFDANTEPHFHLYDNVGDKIKDLIDEDLQKYLTDYFKEKQIPNFKLNEINVQLIGQIQ